MNLKRLFAKWAKQKMTENGEQSLGVSATEGLVCSRSNRSTSWLSWREISENARREAVISSWWRPRRTPCCIRARRISSSSAVSITVVSRFCDGARRTEDTHAEDRWIWSVYSLSEQNRKWQNGEQSLGWCSSGRQRDADPQAEIERTQHEPRWTTWEWS